MAGGSWSPQAPPLRDIDNLVTDTLSPARLPCSENVSIQLHGADQPPGSGTLPPLRSGPQTRRGQHEDTSPSLSPFSVTPLSSADAPGLTSCPARLGWDSKITLANPSRQQEKHNRC